MTTSRGEDLRRFATDVVQRLRDAGYIAYWAGGCVRDLALGYSPNDYDVATDARPEVVAQVFPRRTIPVGESFGVMRVRGPHGAGLEVEVATFRSDGAYVDGRRPETVAFGSPQLDAERRDFTINGMFFDPFNGQVIDYVGGMADLSAKILRAIGNPAARFREDKLRLLRAARFATRYSLKIDPATRQHMIAMSGQVGVVAVERIAQELKKMLTHETRAKAMDLVLETGLMEAILPPVVAMKGIFQGKPVQPEGDLWDHVLLVLSLLPASVSFPLALAALLHDVGKPSTRAFHHGRVSFHNHEQVGRDIALNLCRRLKLSNQERDRVGWLVEYHQYLGEAKKLRESKLKRILSSPGIDELLTLHRADAKASSGDTSHIDYCEEYLKAEPSGPINPPPLVTGHDLVRHGLKPGVGFAALLDSIREAQLERVVNSKREALEWIDRRLGKANALKTEEST